jgi:hypothetical protein
MKMPNAQQFAAFAVNFRDVAVRRVAFHVSDGAGKHPGVKAQDGDFFAGF